MELVVRGTAAIGLAALLLAGAAAKPGPAVALPQAGPSAYPNGAGGGPGTERPTTAGRSSAPPRAAAVTFAERLERQFAAARGVGSGLAVDLRTGRWIWSHLPDRARVPASVTKLFTTSAVLLELGPSKRVATEVVSPVGELVDGRLAGDLHLKGGGDPGFGRAAVDSLARAVRLQGIRSIGGRVLGDDGLFDRIRGVPAQGTGIDPYLGGTLGALPYARYGSARKATEEFVLALRRAGVSVGRGRVGTAVAPALANPVATHLSQPVSDFVRASNTSSDNFVSEMILKLLGTRKGGPGSTAAGLAVARSRLGSLGTGFRQVDGSGLSRGNQVTPRNVIRLLARMEADRWFTGSLAVAGRTGTLSGRLRGSVAAGRCKAKTGTLSGVSALAGYCPSPSGGNVAFALLNNSTSTSDARLRQDRIVNALASWRRPAGG